MLKQDFQIVKKLYKLINKKTAGIIITHLYSNNENIISFKKKFSNKLIIIEDTAINLGAKLNNGKKLGTLFDYGFYSFGIMKNLCAFNGGLIYSKNKKKLKEIEINLNKNNSFPRLRALKIIIFCMLIDIFYNKHIFNLLTFYILKICKKLKISFFLKKLSILEFILKFITTNQVIIIIIFHQIFLLLE